MSANLRIDIRDDRLRGGRLNISARTTDRKERERREADIRDLMDRGELELIERLRAGEIHITEIRAAMKAGDMDRLRRVQSEMFTLGEAADRLLAQVEATRAESTADGYREILRKIRRAFGDGRMLSDIGIGDIERFLHEPKHSRQLKGQPWSPARQAKVCMVGRRLWDFAIAREGDAAERAGVRPRLTRNPWTEVELPRERLNRVAFLPAEKWPNLLAKVEGTPKAAFLALSFLAGLRSAEARHLRTGIDVDFAAGLLRVQPRDGDFQWRPKTDRSVRDVPMGAELRAVLREHVEAGFAGERFFIHAGTDRPLGDTTVFRWTKAAYEAAGIQYGQKTGDGLTYHSGRHSFASWLAQEDVQLLKIAKLLGDTVEVVAQTYAHLLPQDLERTVDVIDRKVGG